ncbi:AAR2 protein-domain-containing protein [Zopfochytrium polystomum]|nr:AAR2 protein-domain-containing protein [Zopfochytrium polystomum]
MSATALPIDQDNARALLREGGFALVLLPPDSVNGGIVVFPGSNAGSSAGVSRSAPVPTSVDFGIDCMEWETGPRFKGIKFVPPGLHFIHCSSRTETGDTGSRSGFFKFFEAREIVVKQWSAELEDFVADETLDRDQVSRMKSRILEFEPFLGPYPLISTDPTARSPYQKWKSLSSMISPSALKRVLPDPSHRVSSILSSSRFSDVKFAGIKKAQAELNVLTRPAGSTEEMDVDSGGLEAPTKVSLDPAAADPRFWIEFTSIDLKRSFPRGASPEVVTKYSLDKSWLLRQTLESKYQGDYKQLLAELQICFILFLVGQAFDGLEQWKCLVQLLCLSVEAIPELAGSLYFDFLGVFHAQLEECPTDFFIDVLSSSSFLRLAIVNLVSNMSDTLGGSCPGSVQATGVLHTNGAQLLARLDLFISLVSRRFKWDLREAVREHSEGSGKGLRSDKSGAYNEEEADDEAPVLVLDGTEGLDPDELELVMRKLGAAHLAAAGSAGKDSRSARKARNLDDDGEEFLTEVAEVDEAL